MLSYSDALELGDGELDRSWECLRRCGNLSSASVLLVLEDVIMQHRPAPQRSAYCWRWSGVLFQILVRW